MKKLVISILLVVLVAVMAYTDKKIIGYRGVDGNDYIVYTVTGEQAIYQDGKFVPISTKLTRNQINNLQARR